MLQVYAVYVHLADASHTDPLDQPDAGEDDTQITDKKCKEESIFQVFPS